MKFGQLIKYDKVNIFLQKSCRIWGRETSSDLVLFFKKPYVRQKQVACRLVSISFDSTQLGIQQKETV